MNYEASHVSCPAEFEEKTFFAALAHDNSYPHRYSSSCQISVIFDLTITVNFPRNMSGTFILMRRRKRQRKRANEQYRDNRYQEKNKRLGNERDQANIDYERIEDELRS